MKLTYCIHSHDVSWSFRRYISCKMCARMLEWLLSCLMNNSHCTQRTIVAHATSVGLRIGSPIWAIDGKGYLQLSCQLWHWLYWYCHAALWSFEYPNLGSPSFLPPCHQCRCQRPCHWHSDQAGCSMGPKGIMKCHGWVKRNQELTDDGGYTDSACDCFCSRSLSFGIT
jgi:hypothetical protein